VPYRSVWKTAVFIARFLEEQALLNTVPIRKSNRAVRVELFLDGSYLLKFLSDFNLLISWGFIMAAPNASTNRG
jgi:hypothetical protein